MKRILLIAGAALALILVALAALPFFIPDSVYKTQIEQSASRALGREVDVAGEVSISIFPVISASVENVTVANPEGFDDPHMIEAGALRGSVKILPLLSRRVEIGELSFEDAIVRLTRLENGETNWMLGDPAASEDETPPETDEAGPFSASIDRASLRNASLVYDDREAGTLYELTNLDMEASLKDMDEPLNAKASGNFQGESFTAALSLNNPQTFTSALQTTVDFEFGSDLGNARFDGTVQSGDALALEGQFSLSVPQLMAVSQFLDLQLPVDMAALGGAQANGSVSGALPDLVIDFETLSLSGDGLNANYTGRVELGQMVRLDGTTDLSARNASLLAESLGLPIQQLAPIRQVSFSAQVAGPATALDFTQIDARTSSPTLTAAYTGSVSTGGDGKLDGTLSAESTQLRGLLDQIGVVLPEGETLGRASVAGDVTGSFIKPMIEGGTYVLDDIEATGQLGVDLSGEKPSVQADLDVGTVDLSPFLGEGSAAPDASGNEDDGWSSAPLDLEALQLVDADLSLTAEEIILGDVRLSNADISALLTNGRLNARLNRFSTFGGDWSGSALVDSSAAVPAMAFSMEAAGVRADSLLGTLAGFSRLSGNGEFAVDVTSNGASMRQIVDALDGSLSLDLSDGALSGINLGQLVRSASSLRETLTAGKLDMTALSSVVSPQAETDFTSFNAALDVSDGVAAVSSLSLVNSVLDISGAGQIDLGARSLDLKLTPAIDRTGSGSAATVQLNGIPVPLRISGSWLSPSFSPDLSAVRSALTAEAGSAIANELGGDLGSIVSGVISGERPSGDTGDQASDTQAPEDEEESAEEEEDPADKAIRNALGSIFGPN